MAKFSIDKDLSKFVTLEEVTAQRARQLLPATLAFLFLVLVGLAALTIAGMASGWPIIVAASVIGGYMALNIGANDVANNMSPAVGSRALPIGVAVLVAAVFETAGALIAGGEVVSTVSKGIIQADMLPSSGAFIVAMISALFAAALWLNLATAVGAPVSTTHSIVGGVLGGGIAMAGLAAADWGVMAKIVASWVISPVMGGVIAAAFLAYIKFTILYREDKLAQAERRVPLLVGLMAGAFVTYLIMKGLSKVWDASLWQALIIGLVVLVATRAAVGPLIRRAVRNGLSNTRGGVAELFTIPVIVGAALLSFAHGSNDVANAIGPLAAIYTTASEGRMVSEAPVPLWILLVGALGISAGLLLYGPKLIRMVGSKITKLNRVRAFCVTLSAAITVIIASTFGIPVSSTHIAIGALFGVGFLREFIVNRENLKALPMKPEPEIDPETGEIIKPNKYRKAKRRYLVRRSHVFTIIGAWLVTVPATALMAGLLALLLGTLGLTAVAG
ncbi:MAG: inorganic phosphate transporter [Pseudomonadota bacterium]